MEKRVNSVQSIDPAAFWLFSPDVSLSAGPCASNTAPDTKANREAVSLASGRELRPSPGEIFDLARIFKICQDHQQDNESMKQARETCRQILKPLLQKGRAALCCAPKEHAKAFEYKAGVTLSGDRPSGTEFRISIHDKSNDVTNLPKDRHCSE